MESRLLQHAHRIFFSPSWPATLNGNRHTGIRHGVSPPATTVRRDPRCWRRRDSVDHPVFVIQAIELARGGRSSGSGSGSGRGSRALTERRLVMSDRALAIRRPVAAVLVSALRDASDLRADEAHEQGPERGQTRGDDCAAGLNVGPEVDLCSAEAGIFDVESREAA